MFCPSCGKEIPDNSRYCLVCGKSPIAVPDTPSNNKVKSHTLRNVLMVCLVLVCVYVAARALNTRTERFTPSSFTVKAGTIYYFTFTVNGSSRVTGRFEAAGGGGNDIEAFIADADNFENWNNGHQARFAYQSGRVTIGNIDAVLPPGKYYLAFNNKFSLITDKAISADIQLHH